jgi:outer membrane receptor protein involved in Fe transport
MKKIIFLISYCLVYFCIKAQTPNTSGSIKGTVMDSIKNQPLRYATVVLIDYSTKQPVKSILSKENGAFEFIHLSIKKYQLSVAMTGFENKIILLPNFSSANQPAINIGNILLPVSINKLKDVEVNAVIVKPIIKQEVDRISYDVQADPENSATNVLDMLRKVPLVSVDASDNIRLKGGTDFKILINGKPSALIAKDPSDILKAMPASNIDRIEVITTPPAKYDAEGLAGIINIITKKNIAQGYNGSINTNYNTIWGPGLNLNGTIKEAKFGMNGYVGMHDQFAKTTSSSGYNNNIFNPVISNLSQLSSRSMTGHNLWSSIELSYEFDSLNLLTGGFNYFGSTNLPSTEQSSVITDANNALLQSFQLGSTGTIQNGGTDVSLNYQLGFKKNKEQFLTASYKYSAQSNAQNTVTAYSDKYNYSLPDFRQYNSSGTKEQTIQLDYIQPGKILTFEAGAKAILRNSYSNFSSDNKDSITSEYINNPAQTNDFSYFQNVYSLYNSYQLKLKKFIVKAGLRAEHTSISADFTSTASSIKQDYNNLIPSVSMQWKMNATNSLNFGFSQRIQRPGIWQLNPFIDRSNPLVINAGNPNLEPVTNHSLELSYSNFKKGSITFGVTYTFANNTIENVTSVGTDTVTINTYQNVGRNRGLSFTLNANYPITKRLNINLNTQLLHVWLSGTYNGQFYNNSGFQGHCFVSTGYTFNKGYHAGFNIGYDSRYVLLQGEDNDYFEVDFSVSKEIMKNKATISVYANDPFIEYRRLDFYTNTNDFHQRNFNEVYGRRINISFRYKFGKLSSSIKQNQRNINNDDVGGRSNH